MALDQKQFEELKKQLQGAQAPVQTTEATTVETQTVEGGGLDPQAFAALKAQLGGAPQPTERERRIEAGLPVGVGRRARPGFAGQVVRGIAQPFARVGATAIRGVQELTGQREREEGLEPIQTRFLGPIAPLPGPFDVDPVTGQRATPLPAIGAGLEIGSTVAIPGAAGVGRAVGREAAEQVARTGARRLIPRLGGVAAREAGLGAAGGAGIALQEEDVAARDIAARAGIGGALGGVLGGRVGQAIGRGVGRVARGATTGLLGISTGVQDDVIREAVEIVSEGGARQEAFREGLRGKLDPFELVRSAEDGARQIRQTRNREFQERLANIQQGQPLEIGGIRSKFDDQVEQFGLNVAPDGTIDFAGARIANPRDREIIQNVVAEFRRFGDVAGDNQVSRVHDLLTFLDDSFVKGTKASAFIAPLRKEVREQLGRQVQGFDQMQKAFQRDTQFLRQIQQTLAAGRGASPETVFKKIISSLRNNNEIRQQVVREFEDVIGAPLTGQIVGQQLSEALSRGLIGSLGATGITTAILSGAISPFFLISLLTASPRVVGEAINALGLPLRVARALKNTINNMAEGIGREQIGALRQILEVGIAREAARGPQE